MVRHRGSSIPGASAVADDLARADAENGNVEVVVDVEDEGGDAADGGAHARQAIRQRLISLMAGTSVLLARAPCERAGGEEEEAHPAPHR